MGLESYELRQLEGYRLPAYVLRNTRLNRRDEILWSEKDVLTELQSAESYYDEQKWERKIGTDPHNSCHNANPLHLEKHASSHQLAKQGRHFVHALLKHGV